MKMKLGLSVLVNLCRTAIKSQSFANSAGMAPSQTKILVSEL